METGGNRAGCGSGIDGRNCDRTHRVFWGDNPKDLREPERTFCSQNGIKDAIYNHEDRSAIILDVGFDDKKKKKKNKAKRIYRVT